MTMVSHPDDVVQLIETAAQAARMPARMRVCYEAGPTGYELQRLLASLGVAWDVVAPSPVPVASGDRVKTDRRDSRRLVRLCRAGEAVAGPGPHVSRGALLRSVPTARQGPRGTAVGPASDCGRCCCDAGSSTEIARPGHSSTASASSGASRPRITRIVVDFPAPLGPTKPVTWPAGTLKVMPSRALVGPNLLCSPQTSMLCSVNLSSVSVSWNRSELVVRPGRFQPGRNR